MKNKKELAASRNEYLKAKKEKKKAKWAEIEKEVKFLTRWLYVAFLFQGEKEKGKWQNFSKKAFGKKGFVKKSIFKTPEQAAGKASSYKSTFLLAHYFLFQVGVGTMGIGGKEMTEYKEGPKYRKGQ